MVIVSLYCDDRELLPEDEWVYSDILKGKITGVGIKPVDGANYPIEIVLNNKSQKVFPGMVVKVKIVNKIYKTALYVSSHYVRESLGEKYVYLAIGGETKKQNIEAGDKIGDYYIVKKGLKSGDKIIIEGIDNVENNSKIKIIDKSI
jgi:multidrug efflux system membrane fusion protein